MKTREEAVRFCSAMPDSYMDKPFRDPNWVVARHKKNKKVFAWIYEKDDLIWINVKCDPAWLEFWRNTYQSVIPGYHLNKEHWNSIILDGTVPASEIERMIGESYDLTRPKSKRERKK